VLTDIANTERHERVLVTAHDVVILMFTYVAEGLDEEAVLERSRSEPLKNAAICRLSRDEESPTGWRVDDYNLDTHLRELGVEVTAQPGASDEVGAGRG
jgi:broad specificity phosphatase PhoE